MGQRISCALKNRSNRFIAGFLILLASVACCFAISTETAYAATSSEQSVTLSVTGTNDQADARTILSKVNAVRAMKTNPNNGAAKTPSPALTWDYDLEKVALQRAAELSVYWSHTRPNGTDCLTAFPTGYRSMGENIHASHGTTSNATTANDGWTKSVGHYNNMVDTSFTCMAAASFKVNGVTYWVELFGKPNLNTTKTSVVSGTKTYSVSALPSNLDLSFSKTLSPGAAIGTTTQYAVVNANKTVSSFPKTPINASSFTWVSSNKNVISVNSTGLAKVVGNGTASVSIKFKNVQQTALSKATNLSKPLSSAKTTASNMTRTVTGGILTPTVTVKYGSTTLKNGTDYYLTYNGSKTAPKKVGNYTVKAVGKGKYSGTKTIGTFKIVKKSSNPFSSTKVYTICSAANWSFVLDAAGKTPKIGANISIWKNNGGKNQKWKIEKQSDGTYIIRSASNNKFVLDAAGKSPRIGANVSIWTSNGGKNQRWYIK